MSYHLLPLCKKVFFHIHVTILLIMFEINICFIQENLNNGV